MLDINLLRKDLAHVVARLETRKKPQAFLDVALSLRSNPNARRSRPKLKNCKRGVTA